MDKEKILFQLLETGLSEKDVSKIIKNSKIITLIQEVRNSIFDYRTKQEKEKDEKISLIEIREALEALKLSISFNSFDDIVFYEKIIAPLDDYFLEKAR